jgi:hypothetical protein
MTTDEPQLVPEGISPDDSPFALPPAYVGFPYDKEGEEAKAIREVIEQNERERAASASAGHALDRECDR